MKQTPIHIKRGPGLPTEGQFLACFWGMFLLYLLISLLPLLRLPEWFCIILTFLPLSVLLLVLIFYYGCCKLHFWSDRITITCCGFTVRTIPAAKIVLVGRIKNRFTDGLCLSCHTVEELARLEEERLRRSVFSRHNVALRKQHHDWQKKFAMDHLFHLRQSAFCTNRDPSLLWLDLTPETMTLVRYLYPQAQVCDSMPSPVPQPLKKPTVVLSASDYLVDFQADGLHILGTFTKKERLFLSAADLRCIVRADRYLPRRHYQVLYLSVQSVQTMAQLGRKLMHADWTQVPFWDQLAVTRYASQQTGSLFARIENGIAIEYSPEAESLLKTLYPQAQWIDLFSDIP